MPLPYLMTQTPGILEIPWKMTSEISTPDVLYCQTAEAQHALCENTLGVYTSEAFCCCRSNRKPGCQVVFTLQCTANQVVTVH